MDLEADLQAATDAVLGGRTVEAGNVEWWLSLLTLAHALDRTLPLKYASQLAGVGFYRAWLRYTVATIGIAGDVAAGVTTAEAASTAVLVALAGLAAEARPFTGNPRACDLYFIHPLIHKVVENSLIVVQPSDLKAVLAHLVAIGDGTTTTTNFGLPENGPLATNDLLEVLSRVSNVERGGRRGPIRAVRAPSRPAHSDHAAGNALKVRHYETRPGGTVRRPELTRSALNR